MIKLTGKKYLALELLLFENKQYQHFWAYWWRNNLWFPGPQSYTGEDMAEIHIHGGKAVIRALLETISKIKIVDWQSLANSQS